MEWYDYETENTNHSNSEQHEGQKSATDQDQIDSEYSDEKNKSSGDGECQELMNSDNHDTYIGVDDGRGKVSKQDVLDDIFDSLVISDEPGESVASKKSAIDEDDAEVPPQDVKNHRSHGIAISSSNHQLSERLISPEENDGTFSLSRPMKDVSLAEQLENIQNASKVLEDEDRSGSGWFSRKSKSSNNSKRYGGEKSVASSHNSAMDKSNCSSAMGKSSMGEDGKLSRAGSVASFIGFGFAVDNMSDEVEEDFQFMNEGTTKEVDNDEEDDPYGFGEDFNHDEVLQEFHSTPIPSDDGDSHHTSDVGNEVINTPVDEDASTKKSMSSLEDKSNDVEPEHKNQALFDIIEQSFDSIEPFYAAGFDKDLKSTEVKVCFAAYIYVFTPPQPSPLAVKFNHKIDEELQREKIAQEQTFRGGKTSWLFQWKRKNVGDLSNNTLKKVKEEEDEKYTFEVVPKKIVYALWTEVLYQVGFVESDENLGSVLDHIRDSLVQVGLLDSSIIDLTLDQENSEDCIDLEGGNSLECEYIAAHHAINGQYGEYLSRWNRKIKQMLERCEDKFFAVVSKIPDERGISVRDYSLGMLPYTSSRGMIFDRAIDLLTKESFTRSRMNYFGIIEGATIHVTDVEFVICKRNDMYLEDKCDQYDYSGFMKKAFDLVKVFIDESLECDDKDFERPNELCDEAGRAFHLMGVSLIAQGLGQEGLANLAKAVRLKESDLKLNGGDGSVSLSDTLHCIGLAYGVIGDFKEALSSYREALRMRSNLLGKNDLRVAETCHSMVSVILIYTRGSLQSCSTHIVFEYF